MSPTLRESSPRLFTTTLGLAALFASCGGSGGGGGGSSAATAELMVASTGNADLFALCADVEAVRMVRADGGRTDNLLPARTTLEFVGLQDVAAWLAAVEVDAATYTGLAVEIAPSSVHAMSLGGSNVDLNVAPGPWEIELDQPVVVEGGSRTRMELVLDLDRSVSGDVPNTLAPPRFEPIGDVFLLDDDDRERDLDELFGLVVAVSPSTRTFTLEVYHDDALKDPMGRVRVRVEQESVLIDVGGTVFPGPEGLFASLRVGLTVVEVEGSSGANGLLRASRVEIVDHAGDRPPQVEVEGMVIHLFDSEEGFVLLLREIENGAEIAEPVLASIGDPSSIDVVHDGGTRFLDSAGRPASADDLRVGQLLDVSFDTFSQPPFLASEIELEATGACYQGIIRDVDGDAGEIVIRLDDDMGIHDDELYGETDEVTVELDGAQVYLDLRGRPWLDVEQLVAGMKIRVCGSLETRDDDLDGVPDRAVVVAEKAVVKPGHLIKGDVVSGDRSASTFRLGSGQIVTPFGGQVGSGAVTVVIGDDTDFRKDAESEAHFFDLVEALQGDDSIDVKIKGIGSSQPDEIVAYEIKVDADLEDSDDNDDSDDDGDDD